MEEIWKPIIGYENHYEISSIGRVRNVQRNKLVKSYVSKKGYRRVQIAIDTIKKNYFVHRLVADAFIPNPEGKNVVNHKDFDRSNNSVDNLEWVTSQENAHYSMDHIVEARLKSTMSSTKHHNIYPNGRHFQIRVRRYGREIINKTFPTLEQAVMFLKAARI